MNVLLNELINDSVDLENILLKLSAIMQAFPYNDDTKRVHQWINHELQGYPKHALPDYRILHGLPIGDYEMEDKVYTNKIIPLEYAYFSEEDVQNLQQVPVYNPIGELDFMLANDVVYQKNINPKIYLLASELKISKIKILDLSINVPTQRLRVVINAVKLKLIQIIFELQKYYPDIEQLNISSAVQGNKKVALKVLSQLNNIIYQNQNTHDLKNQVARDNLGNE